MGWQRQATPQALLKNPCLQLAEKTFKRFCERKRIPNPSIPRLIHFIWLGSPLPCNVSERIGSWKMFHPGWKVQVWSEKELRSFSWSNVRLKTAFEKTGSLAEKADIWRLEILYQFGGVYSDTDVICLRSFQDLVESGLSFFGGLEMNHARSDRKDPFYVGTAVLGAAKKCAILQSCMDLYQTKEEAPHLELDLRAGPGLISQACKLGLQQFEETMLLLPCSYFYPASFEARWTSGKNPMEFVSRESFALHLWDSSWLF